MNYTYFAIACGITLSCNMPAAMQQPIHEQKNEDKKQVSSRPGLLGALDKFLPENATAIVCNYLQQDYRAYRHSETIPISNYITNHQLSENNEYLLLGFPENACRYHIQTKKSIDTIHYERCYFIHLLAHSSTFLTITNNNDIQLHDFKSQKSHTFNQNFKFCAALLHNDGSRILARYFPCHYWDCNHDWYNYDYNDCKRCSGHIGIFDVPSKELVSSKKLNSRENTKIALSPNNTLLAYTQGATSYLLTPDMQRSVQLIGHQRNITDISISTDNSYALSASEDHTARLWKTENGTQLRVFRHPCLVRSAQFDLTGATILTGSLDGKVRLFDRDQENEEFILPAHRLSGKPAFSLDGSRIHAAQADSIHLWNGELALFLNNLRIHRTYA